MQCFWPFGLFWENTKLCFSTEENSFYFKKGDPTFNLFCGLAKEDISVYSFYRPSISTHHHFFKYFLRSKTFILGYTRDKYLLKVLLKRWSSVGQFTRKKFLAFLFKYLTVNYYIKQVVKNKNYQDLLNISINSENILSSVYVSI